MLWLIYCESANYCGYGQHFVVEADSEEEAREKVFDSAEEYFYEQDGEQLEEDGVLYDCYSTIESVEPFDQSHRDWKYYKDPSQSEFYIEVDTLK